MALTGRIMRRRESGGDAVSLVTDALVLVSVGFFLFWVGLNRYIAPDEGFYLMAAKLVMQGQSLYQDFFYPQMPLVPYLQGVWLRVFGVTWEQGRIFASLLTFLSAVVLYIAVRQWTSRIFAIVAIVIFAGSGPILGWLPTIQTYNASTLFCLLSYFCLHSSVRKKHWLMALLSGVLLGLAINCRLFYVVVIPICVLWILLGKAPFAIRIKDLSIFLIGGLLTALPHLYLMFYDFSTYWFNNMGYHSMRSEMTAERLARHRRAIVEIAFGFRDDPRSDGYQLLIIFCGTLAHAVLRILRKSLPDVSFWIGMTLLFVSMTPVPMHIQYFVAVFPFFIICTMLFFSEIHQQCVSSHLAKFVLAPFAIALLLVYLQTTPHALNRYTNTGYGVHGIEPGKPEAARISTVKKVSQTINLLTEPDEIVLSQWPGYLVESHARPYPGTENQFWIRVAHQLSPQERSDYKIVGLAEFRAALEDPALRVIIIREDRIRRFFGRRGLEATSFKLSYDIEGVHIYTALD